MARSTRKSLASSAASAARKVLPRRPSKSAPAKQASSATKTASKKSASAKKATAKKAAPAKKATAKKPGPAKKSTAKKTAPARKSTAKKAPTKKAATKKAAPAKKTAAKKSASQKSAPAKKATAKKATAKKAAPAKKATAKKPAPAKKTSAKKTSAAKKTATAKTAKKAAPAKKATPAKKVATKKTAATKAGALKVKEGEGAWTKTEIKEVLDELHEDRERVTRALEAQEAELVGLMRDAGDGAGQDQADMGATSFERDHELIVLNNEREKLAQIDRALARIDDGTYGICESCGNPIGKMRAMAFPRATLCLTCKQREERR